jgi:2,3,4,5-tetrahydropyridine-2,6-dicarboxylate N-succinyltransferase
MTIDTEAPPNPVPRVPGEAVLAQGAAGIGLASLSQSGVVLDVWYPEPELGQFSDSGVEWLEAGTVPDRLRPLIGTNAVCEVNVTGVRTTIADLSLPPRDAYDAYLRLHLLSHRMIRPHQANFDGVEDLLADVVWTNHGPVPADDFSSLHRRLRAFGPFTVHGVGKLPRMVDYVIPSGVRIADGARVQLGAHLAPGTTVMAEGFVDYDAGTLGGAIIEGQVTAGCVIGDGSDVGGGSGSAVITVGKRCLVGANAELEISLGDDCVVETGLHVAADTIVLRADGSAVPASTVAGVDHLHLRRNSVTGAVEALPWHGKGVDLNAELLANG